MPSTATVRLELRRPFWPDSLFGHLVATAVPGVEEWRDGAYRRTLRLAHGAGIAALAPRNDHIDCRLILTDSRDREMAVALCRRLLDLDADPVAIDAALSADATLAPLVAAAPGRRVPGSVDGAEMALRAVLGQQVSTAAARTHAGRLVVALGEVVDDPEGGLSHLFPTPAAVAGIDADELRLPMSRRATLVGVARALASVEIDLSPGADRVAAMAGLASLPGVGPWTMGTIAMRALGDADVFLATDLGVRSAAGALGLPGTASALTAHAQRWRPWRSYAVQHLWGTSPHAINSMPVDAVAPR